MGHDSLKCYGELQKELSNARSTLLTLNDNIRKIVGRNPRGDPRIEKLNKFSEPKKNAKDRPEKRNSDFLKSKRRNNELKSVFNRLSESNSRSSDEELKPKLNSRVIRELPSRQDIVEAQGNDVESRARNRRIFSSLLGTLHKFCQEESRLKQKVDKKAQIEKKVEDKELRERENIRKERETLFQNRKKKQLEIKNIEFKLNRLQDFEAWKSSISPLKNHIRTRTKPHIYFRPNTFRKGIDKLLMENKCYINSIIEEKQKTLTCELEKYQTSSNNDCSENLYEAASVPSEQRNARICDTQNEFSKEHSKDHAENILKNQNNKKLRCE